MRRRPLLTVICCVVVVISGLVTHFSEGIPQVRAWGMAIAGMGSLFLVWGGVDVGEIHRAGPEKLGCFGLILGALLVIGGLWAVFTGNMPGGMGVPDWLKP
jgi:hypothetical protein